MFPVRLTRISLSASDTVDEGATNIEKIPLVIDDGVRNRIAIVYGDPGEEYL